MWLISKSREFFAPARSVSLHPICYTLKFVENLEVRHLIEGMTILDGQLHYQDERDGQLYNVIENQGKFWIAENFKFDCNDSWCYENELANCEKYGRLYTWDAAKNICPPGWKIPSATDWETLIKAKKYNFTTLGGYRTDSGTFLYMSSYGYYWSSTLSGKRYTTYFWTNGRKMKSGTKNLKAACSVCYLQDF